MRILYFSRDYTTHDRRFLAKMSQSRHEIWFARLEDDGMEYEKRSLPDGVRTVTWPGGSQRYKTPAEWLRLMPYYESVLDEIRPDLVHAGPVQSCGLLTAIAGFHPLLVMSWGSDILVDADRDEFWRWMTRYTLIRADMVLSDCNEVSEKVCQLAGKRPDQIIQFPWGIDLTQFSPGEDTLRLRDREGWKGASVVLSTRAWEPYCGTEVSLEGFRLAYSAEPRLRLVLLGGGSLAPVVRRYVEENDLAAAVCAPGIVSPTQLPEYFRAADLYVSCAYSDGTSVSLLEAMATGLPVVVTDRASNREWVSHGENGWLAAARSPESVAECILAAVRLDPEQRSGIARTNRSITEQRANWDRTSEKLLAAYDRMERGRAAVPNMPSDCSRPS